MPGTRRCWLWGSEQPLSPWERLRRTRKPQGKQEQPQHGAYRNKRGIQVPAEPSTRFKEQHKAILSLTFRLSQAPLQDNAGFHVSHPRYMGLRVSQWEPCAH